MSLACVCEYVCVCVCGGGVIFDHSLLNMAFTTKGLKISEIYISVQHNNFAGFNYLE